MLAFLITILIALFVWNMGGLADEPKITYNGAGEESESDQAATLQDIDGIKPEEDNVIEADADIIMEDKAGETDISGQTQKQEKVVDNTQANTERFYQAAEEEFGLSPDEAQSWFDIVTEDDIFNGGSREISNLIFDDIDRNGKTDMIIMVQETEMKYLYGTGALYFYMKESISMVHIGYCIGRPWWHREITSEALKAVMDYLFDIVDVNRIESRHDPSNPNSGKVMKKCGMKYEGTLRSSDWNNQGVCDAGYYALLESEC